MEWVPAETWPQVAESVACMVLIGFVLWLVFRFLMGR